ncbi:hypothetical protein U9R62_07820 [Cylindrospermopsis raciborskii DSH]|uniref:hypothetical protein n=1 Tax=Cylindrospermopsis raciborskii TaxID=77022 RepID=UPI002EDBB529
MSLVGNIWTNPGEIAGDGIDNDGGYIDDIRGWDFAYNDNNPSDVQVMELTLQEPLLARDGNGWVMTGVGMPKSCTEF